MPLAYIHGGKVVNYYGLPDVDAPDDNGKEYKLYLHVMGLFKDASRSSVNLSINVFGVSNAAEYLSKRFFGRGDDYYIIPEKKEIAGFPDIVLIRENLVILMDHFKVDASRQIVNKHGGAAGTEYEQLCGKLAADDLTTEEFEREVESMSFTVGQFRTNFLRSLEKKSQRREGYLKAFAEHQSRFGDEIARIDFEKPKEYWLLVENVTPRMLTGRVDPILSELARSGFDGLVCVNNPVVGKMPTSIDQVEFYCDLKGEGAQRVC